LPNGWELFKLKSLKAQVPFSSFADEKEPFKAKLIEPLSSGMMNLSWGVKVLPFCAFTSAHRIGKTRTIIIAAASPIRAGLLVVTFKVSQLERINADHVISFFK